jgi:hypothetical protein
MPAYQHPRTPLLFNKEVIPIRFIIMPDRTTFQINIHAFLTLEDITLQLQHTISHLNNKRINFEIEQGKRWIRVNSEWEWSLICTDFRTGPRTEPLYVRVSVKKAPLHLRRSKKISAVRVPSEKQYQHKARVVLQPIETKSDEEYSIPTDEIPTEKLDFNDLFDVIMERDAYYLKSLRR